MNKQSAKKRYFGITAAILLLAVVVTCAILPTTLAKYVIYNEKTIALNVGGVVINPTLSNEETITTFIAESLTFNSNSDSKARVYWFDSAGRISRSGSNENTLDSNGKNYGQPICREIEQLGGYEENSFTFVMYHYIVSDNPDTLENETSNVMEIYFVNANLKSAPSGTMVSNVYKCIYTCPNRDGSGVWTRQDDVYAGTIFTITKYVDGIAFTTLSRSTFVGALIEE